MSSENRQKLESKKEQTIALINALLDTPYSDQRQATIKELAKQALSYVAELKIAHI